MSEPRNSPRNSLRLDDFVPFRLSYTSNLVSEAIARIYESLFGLSVAEWRLIAVIAEHEGISQTAICTRTGMDKVTVSRAAIALSSRGLVARASSETDRRLRDLRLSDTGEVLYAQVAPKAIELEKRIFGSLGAAEISRFVALLRRIDETVGELSD